jgi:predicted Fe-Mo cluster-binding NifX family protein
MKVAVASQGPDLNSQVALRFGRARYFLIVDTASGAVTFCDNSRNSSTGHTAGMQAAGGIVSLGVGAVISRCIGPKAFATLQAGNVEVYAAAPGTVGDAIEKLKAGQLRPAREANVREHWTQEPTSVT